MKKILAISILFVVIMSICDYVFAQTITVVKDVPQMNNNYGEIYSKDINTVERYLFGRTYAKDNIHIRLNRIEHYLFNRNYPSMNLANRVNNIMTNYRSDYNDNYLSNYYDNSTGINRIRNRFMGYPTGFTPQIMMPPSYSGINRNIQTNRGYMYNNSVPATAGAGIQILN